LSVPKKYTIVVTIVYQQYESLHIQKEREICIYNRQPTLAFFPFHLVQLCIMNINPSLEQDEAKTESMKMLWTHFSCA